MKKIKLRINNRLVEKGTNILEEAKAADYDIPPYRPCILAKAACIACGQCVIACPIGGTRAKSTGRKTRSKKTTAPAATEVIYFKPQWVRKKKALLFNATGGKKMDCSGLRQKYEEEKKRGLDYRRTLEISQEVERSLKVQRRQLNELEAKGGDHQKISELKNCINKDEDLLQAVKFQMHGLNGI